LIWIKQESRLARRDRFDRGATRITERGTFRLQPVALQSSAGVPAVAQARDARLRLAGRMTQRSAFSNRVAAATSPHRRGGRSVRQ
jgi:hypothetical protein